MIVATVHCVGGVRCTLYEYVFNCAMYSQTRFITVSVLCYAVLYHYTKEKEQKKYYTARRKHEKNVDQTSSKRCSLFEFFCCRLFVSCLRKNSFIWFLTGKLLSIRWFLFGKTIKYKITCSELWYRTMLYFATQ